MRSHVPRNADLAGVGLIAAGILLLELGLTRLLSVASWYHFAFFSISLALMGLGASGVLVFVLRDRLRSTSSERLLVIAAVLFSGLSIALMLLFLYTPLAAAPLTGDTLSVIAAYLAGMAPFFAGGFYLAVAISRFSRSVTRVYAADLMGAAAGCLLFIPLLGWLGGPGPLLAAAMLGVTAASLGCRQRGLRTVLAGLGALIFGVMSIQATSPLLDIRFEKGQEALPKVFSKWNSYSRIAVYDTPHVDWGMSTTVDFDPVPSLRMDIDASASTAILQPDDPNDVEYLRYDISSLGHRLLEPGSSTLIIGPGGGRDIWASLIFGATSVTGVEINSIIVDDVMTDRFFEASLGVYEMPGVEIVVGDGRNYIARSETSYDLIQASLVDTWAATSAGAFSLSESNLYTVEAFVSYLSHLSEDGFLSVSRWTEGSLRLVSLAREAAAQLGWGDLASHVFVAASDSTAEVGGVATLIVTRQPLSSEEVSLLERESEGLGFEVLYAPVDAGAPKIGRSDFISLVTEPDFPRVVDEFEIDVSPVTDDRPFFFQSLKIDDWTALFDARQASSSGISLTARLLLLSIALTALLILLPLRFSARGAVLQVQRPLPKLAYFGLLGLGFIVLEIGLIQRFVLYLGHPVYSLTVVLFTFLLGAGIGSAVSRRFTVPEMAARFSLTAVVVLGLAYSVSLPGLLSSWLGLPLGVRIVSSVALLMPLALLMGMPLPSGVRSLSRDSNEDLVAWAWGLNGAASVVGSALSVIIALIFGFTVVTLSASALYLFALLVHLTWYRGAGGHL